MRYLELNKEAKQNALNDYCDLFKINLKDWIDLSRNENLIKEWFEETNHDILTRDGFLKNRKNRNYEKETNRNTNRAI